MGAHVRAHARRDHGRADLRGAGQTPAAAAGLATSGEIEFAPCHHYAAAGPMAGIISPSMPVFIVRNETTGHVAFATQNEGLGKVLRYGAYGPEVIRCLKWMEQTLYPALRAALAVSRPIDLRSMVSQRCTWATSATTATRLEHRCSSGRSRRRWLRR
jgi:hypothetical protein